MAESFLTRWERVIKLIPRRNPYTSCPGCGNRTLTIDGRCDLCNGRKPTNPPAPVTGEK